MWLALLQVRTVFLVVRETHIIRNLQVAHPCHPNIFFLIRVTLPLLYRLLIIHVEETMHHFADARG
jgi:hypothetical protein